MMDTITVTNNVRVQFFGNCYRGLVDSEEQEDSTSDLERNNHPSDFLATITGKPWNELSSFISPEYINVKTQVGQYITDYVNNGHCHHFGLKITQLIQLNRNHDPTFTTIPGSTNRKMLWHGTKKSRVAGIFERGFLRPNSFGQMFGNGIYFADRVTKSAQYCDAQTPGQKGYLFLCDVNLGRMYGCCNANHGYVNAPDGFDSVKGIGRQIPDPRVIVKYNGSTFPFGKTIMNGNQNGGLIFNEFVVYDLSRVRIEFLVEVEFL